MIEKVNAVIVEAVQEELLIMPKRIILKIHLCRKDQRINQNLKAKRIRHNETIVLSNSRRNKNKYN